MKKPWLRMLIAYSGLALMPILATAVCAQPRSQNWAMVSDHPVGTVAGDAIRSFAASLARHTDGALTGRVTSKSKPAAADLIVAIQEGRAQVADLFAGSLARLDPIFELPTLPFVVQSVDQAERLACIAEPAYRRALARVGLHLLFVSPWPPTGLWSRQPVLTARDIATLKVRTYDDASAQVLQSMGARAAALPVQDVGRLLRTGGLDAVLSSGDGTVGMDIGGRLSNFSVIRYAYPTSFVVMSETSYEALPMVQQREVDDAAQEASREQWGALPRRIRANYSRMQRAGVVVNTSINKALDARLHDAGRAVVEAWLSRAPADDYDILSAFRKADSSSTENPCATKLLEAVNSTHG